MAASDPRAGLSRRTFLAGSLAAGLGATGFLAACGDRGAGAGRAGDTADVTDPTDPSSPVVVVNEPLAIDDETLGQFEELTGLGLRYEEYPQAGAYLDAQAEALRSDRPPADVVILPDAVATRAVRDQLLPVRPAASDRPVLEGFADPPFDPERRSTLPWQGWLVTLAYDRERFGTPPTDLAAIFERRHRGRVTLPASPRLLLGTLILAEGGTPAKAGASELRAALRTLERARRSGQLVRFTDNGAGQDLAVGTSTLVVGAAPQIQVMRFARAELTSAIAEQGALLDGSSLFVTARDAAAQDRARRFLDYAYSPARNAQIAKFMTSIPTVPGGAEELANIAPELALEPTIGVRPGAWKRISSPPLVPPDVAAACVALTGGDERAGQRRSSSGRRPR